MAVISERGSVDATIARCPGAMDGQRLFSTPADDIVLALRPDPPSRQGLHWIDPDFGALYILGNAANGLVKIGAAALIRKRFTAMNAASPVELRLLHFVHLVGAPVAKVVEADVHAGLLEHRRRGEWFELELDAAAEAIAEAVVRARLTFWTESERRSVGATAAKYHAHRMRRGL